MRKMAPMLEKKPTQEKTSNLALYHKVSQFLYEEARLQDEHEYDVWESLWTDDGVYWIPANGDDIDPDHEMSIVYDNRSRIGLRVRQLYTGKRFAQEPASDIRRVISNIEVRELDNGEIDARSNAIVFESNLRGQFTWSTRNRFRLRPEGEGFKMARKEVVLTNNSKALYTLAFLI